MENKLRDEQNRTRQLKLLLFESSSVYGDHALFEHLTEDVQDQIKIFLVEAVGKLQEAVELLDRRYHWASNTSHHQVNSSTMFEKMRESSKSPFRVIQWSFRDKKRTETILMEFTDLNRRIQENIKLFLLGSSLSVNHQQHLQHLQSDPVSRQLGFDVDATLRLNSENAERNNENFELPATPWEAAIPRARPTDKAGRHYAIISDVDLVGVPVILEYRRYEPTVLGPFANPAQTVDERTKKLLNGLTRLLQQPKEQAFLIPRCRGWRYIAEQEQIAFVFDIPSRHEHRPLSLLDLLRCPKTKLSLNEKLQVAFGLARSISQLQMVRWVGMACSFGMKQKLIRLL